MAFNLSTLKMAVCQSLRMNKLHFELKEAGLVNSHAHCGPDKYRLTRKKKCEGSMLLDWATTRVYDSVWQIMWA